MTANDDDAASVSDAFAALYVGLSALAEALGEADPALATRLEKALSETIENSVRLRASITTLNLLKHLRESVAEGRQIRELR